MPKPISRKDFIRRMRQLGFDGPHHGTNHAKMRRNTLTVTIPNPHGGDIDWNLTKRILKQAGIAPEEWDATA